MKNLKRKSRLVILQLGVISALASFTSLKANAACVVYQDTYCSNLSGVVCTCNVTFYQWIGCKKDQLIQNMSGPGCDDAFSFSGN